MFIDNIRYKIGSYYLKKADNEINKGDFESIKRGLKYVKKAISIVPPSKDLADFGK